METKIDEVAPDVFRLSTWVSEIAPPAGFTFNQFVVRGAEPFLFHTGMRQLFPLVSAAVAKIVPLDDLRWISFGHVEADECGAMNQFLAAAPAAQVVHGDLACMVSLNDLCDRPPRAIGEDVLDIGGHVLRFVPTPHVPHNWESGLWFDETTRTLLAGDLFTQIGDSPATTESDIVEAALTAEEIFHATSLTQGLASTLQRLATFEPTTLALMHGPTYHGDGADQLRGLAAGYATITMPDAA
ncbi:MAG TPA: MBL fold metallo-hydrolase [Acidimicrobiales bacterium]|jgi:flavorubredoxin|nr:MBL fold metallo-hydrolase [Acidimicrobiales bacterium]